MANWEYGGAYMRHNMDGIIEIAGNSKVMVCDWLHSMPDFMKEADTLFIDPPWNLGNIKSFYTKAEKPYGGMLFLEFISKLWERIDAINPETLFLEMGKQHLAHCLIEAERRFHSVTFYNSTYFKKAENKCYIIHATNDRKHKRYRILEDQDEADIIAWICQNHGYECIGDLCMGRGLVGRHAVMAGRRFVGTELNPKRLAVLIEWIAHNMLERAIHEPS